MYDIVLGTLATAIACLIITRIPSSNKLLWTVPVVCAVVNGIIVGAELHFVLKLPFWLNFVTVGFGELVVVAIGAVVFYFLMQNQSFKKLIA